LKRTTTAMNQESVVAVASPCYELERVADACCHPQRRTLAASRDPANRRWL